MYNIMAGSPMHLILVLSSLWPSEELVKAHFIIASSKASYNTIAFIPSTILHFYGLLGAGYAMA